MAKAAGAKRKPIGPIGLVIFGVTGDLAHRKLVPALYQLALEGHLPEELHIIGFARRDWGDEKLRSEMRAALEEYARTKPLDKKVLETILKSMHYVPGTFDDQNGYLRLEQLLQKLKADNRLFYLATPPSAYLTIIEHLGRAKLASCPQGWTRIVVEKPYGRDLQSAKELEQAIHGVFQEDQIYRIDHYLGKETVQNILVFRFANGIFEPLWNRRYVDSVQITVSETIGVNGRAEYFDSAGVIRDMLQNHILQLLTLTAMEAPVTFSADAVRDEKVKVLRGLHLWRGEEVMENTVRAQYAAGQMKDEHIRAYLDHQGVAKNSQTETLLALRVFVDNWRWAGVPFFIRSGKHMPRRLTEIAVQYKQVPLSLFGARNMAGDAPNRLLLNIQPEEGITLTFGAKQPGGKDLIRSVKMDFSYAEAFGQSTPEAYERLLMDCMQGDATLFTRTDEVLAAWTFVDEILKGWAAHPRMKLPQYKPDTWGPPEMDEFIRPHGHAWRKID
ncbi:MAG: glucose-6-phosphate dehydrogenase [Anaerolineales bacterium]